jgi:2-hydroxychromene-2-carboxylate isomerase
MAKTLPFYFDYSCPYAYLASTQVEALSARTGMPLEPRPILLGGVFRARGTAQNLSDTLHPAKAQNNLLDMQRHAAAFGVTLTMPPSHPMRTVTALRATLAAGAPFLPLAHRFFAAYWVRGLDLMSDEGVATVLREAGLDADAVLEKARSPEIKAELRRATDQALDDGVFGVPAFVVDGTLYWGQDRMDEVERALGFEPPTAAQEPVSAPVDFWFDYSSPYAYVASARVEDLIGPTVRFRPMLLGAVFAAVGTEGVPILATNEAKRRFLTQDIHRQAASAGVGFHWASRFPLRTVLPLRMTLLADANSEAGRRFVHRVYRACWSEDLDCSDPAVATALADEVGLDGAALVARSSDPETKQLLRDATSEAVEAGIFGAPTCVVDGGPRFWGNDRLEFARRAAAGDRTLLDLG